MADFYPYYHTYVENPFACENTFGARLHQPNPWAYYNYRNPLSDIEAQLVESLVDKVRVIALCRPLLLAADGLVSYVIAFRMAFRSKVPHWRGEIGRCKMVSWPDIAIVQVVKQRAEGVLTVDRRIVQGSQGMVECLIKATQNGKGVTPYLRWVQVSIRLSSNGSTPPFACV